MVEQGSALFALLPRVSGLFAHTATEVLLGLGETGNVPGCMTLGTSLSLLGAMGS